MMGDRVLEPHVPTQMEHSGIRQMQIKQVVDEWVGCNRKHLQLGMLM